MHRQGQLATRNPASLHFNSNNTANYNNNHNDYSDLSYNYKDKQQKLQDLEVLNSEIYETLAFKNVDSLNYSSENNLHAFNAQHHQQNIFHSNQENFNNYSVNNSTNTTDHQHQQKKPPIHPQPKQKAPLKKFPPNVQGTPPNHQLKPALAAKSKLTPTNNTNNSNNNKANFLGQHRVTNRIPNNTNNIKQFEPVAQRHLANRSNDNDTDYYYKQDLLFSNNFPQAFNNKSDEIISLDSYLSNQSNKNSINQNSKDYSHVGSKINTNLKNRNAAGPPHLSQQQLQLQEQLLQQQMAAFPLFEKNMNKTKNNQSSFAKNPTHSYSDQFYASLPGYPVPKPNQKVPPFVPPPGGFYPPIYPPQYAAAMAAAAAAYGYPPAYPPMPPYPRFENKKLF